MGRQERVKVRQSQWLNLLQVSGVGSVVQLSYDGVESRLVAFGILRVHQHHPGVTAVLFAVVLFGLGAQQS